jgi:hypothetical protein
MVLSASHVQMYAAKAHDVLSTFDATTYQQRTASHQVQPTLWIAWVALRWLIQPLVHIFLALPAFFVASTPQGLPQG